jgi:class 3 adenylate cyclase
MGAADGWPRVWAEMSDEDLRDQLRHYLFLAADGPNRHAGRIVQLVPEADRCGKAQMVDEAMQWVKSHEPSKQE